MLTKMLRLAVWTACALLSGSVPMRGQAATASLSGVVTDAQGAVVAGAKVEVVDLAKNLKMTRETDRQGRFAVTQVAASSYSVRVESAGFAVAEIPRLVLNVIDDVSVRVSLKVAGQRDAVTVLADTTAVNESAAVSTTIDRQFIANQPLNGRSVQTLVELSPGVELTPSSLTVAGQFSVNGQRASANYVTVDGVSGNFGSTASVTLYESAGGSIPSYSALGTSSSLASVDAVQEFTIQTSTYAPEFGRQPGGQVSIVTRSGTNVLHGNAFDYLRNSVLDANSWFANHAGLAKPAERQNDFGFTLGGPVLLPRMYDGRGKTFFFVSYEGVRLRQPGVTATLQVPSLTARANATGALADVLKAFPLPTGPSVAGDPTEAPFIGSYSNPLTLNATSFRLDHAVSQRLTVFGRYNHAPSEDKERARFCAASCVADLTYGVDTVTAGATLALTPRLSNDVRFNYSMSRTNQTYFIDTYGGAIVPPSSSLYPSFTTRDKGYIYIELNGAGSNTISDGLFSDNKQRQYNVVDALSLTTRGHAMKFGVDYRRLAPISNSGNYKRSFLPDNVPDLVNNVATAATIVAPQYVLYPVYTNTSVYAQDVWRVWNRMTLTYGLRYDVNPPPSEQNGNLPPTVLNVSDPANLTLAPAGTKLYQTSYGNVAPRVGFSLRPFASDRTILRGGAGLYYDLGYDFTGSAFSTGIYPFAKTLSLSAVTFTSAAFAVQPPAVNPNPPYTRVFAYSQDFKVPYTVEVNAAVEQRLSAADSVSVTYVGAVGERLGRVESLRKANANFPRLDIVRNTGSSNYNALQMEYRRRLRGGLQALASYTYGKSIDTVSDESINNFQAPTTKYDPDQDRGPSGFDVHHTFMSAVSYELPSPAAGAARAVLGGFGVDGFFRARTALPINILTGRDAQGLGFTTVARPDVVAGVPVYVSAANVPGGRKINAAAFNGVAPVAALRQGSLSRNSLRGFNLTQVDLTLRRRFSLTERVKLQANVDAFNLFNHPNFANPVAILSDPNFGVSTQTLASGLAGLSSLYQVGGPRSLQVALKLSF